MSITYPILIEGLPAPEYHRVDAVSASRLKAMRRSALHCRWEMDHPRETDAMRFGSAVHAAVLEPARFAAEYVVAGVCSATVKATGVRCDVAGKVLVDGQWRCGTHGKGLAKPMGDVLSPDDADAVRCIREAVTSHPSAGQLLTLPGMTEVSAFWTDDTTGLPCKCRADRVVEVPGFGRVCVDLKTTPDASPAAFKFAARALGYDVAAAFYLDGLAKVGVPCDAYGFIAAESDGPYAVAVYLLADADLDKGRAQAANLMEAAKAARASGVWAGYPAGFVPLTLPKRDWEYQDSSY